MVPNRVLTDVEFERYVLVPHPIGDKAHHVSFARRKSAMPLVC
jgi:hypothetical protein